jgi:hypothetical protein
MWVKVGMSGELVCKVNESLGTVTAGWGLCIGWATVSFTTGALLHGDSLLILGYFSKLYHVITETSKQKCVSIMMVLNNKL